jgi:hypothetical protein
MIFPIQGQLESLTAASNRRFTSWTASQVQRSIDDQNSEMKALVDAQSEDQKQRHDEFLKLYDELVEAMKPLSDFSHDASTILEKVKQVDQLWQWFQTQAYKSAGGHIDANKNTTPPDGFPYMTGDVRWTLNGVPDGWLECDGKERATASYPELATVIALALESQGFDVPGDGDKFMLPTREQCPGYVVGMSPAWRAIVRY